MFWIQVPLDKFSRKTGLLDDESENNPKDQDTRKPVSNIVIIENGCDIKHKYPPDSE